MKRNYVYRQNIGYIEIKALFLGEEKDGGAINITRPVHDRGEVTNQDGSWILDSILYKHDESKRGCTIDSK